MKQRRTFVLLLVLLVVLAASLAACGGDDGAPSQSEGTQETAASDALEGWIDYTAPDGSFSVRLPEQPEVQEQTLDTAEGEVILVIYTVQGEEAAWLISTNTMPPITAEAISSGDEQVVADILEGGRDGALANIGGTLDSEKAVEVNGNPGLELRFSAPGGEGTGVDEIRGAARIVLIGTTLYQVLLVTTPDGMDDTVQPFLDSFQGS